MNDRMTILKTYLHDHSWFINDRLASFVGREQELADIRDHIAALQPFGGYVTITGQAGQGKSCVIAKLVDDYGRDRVVHHFIPCVPGPDHQVDLLGNLIAQLCLKYDLPAFYMADDSRPALRDSFPRVLDEIARTGAQEVIFIDGVDQLEEDASGRRDLSFLPINPPMGIVLVLGARPNDTLKPLELRKECCEYHLPNLSRDDFDLLLQYRGVALHPLLADRCYQVMEASAFYLDLVAKELIQQEDLGPEAVIGHIADDPDNLFSLLIDRLKHNRPQWQTVLRPLLGVLLATQQPLSQQALQVLIDGKAEIISDGLQRLGGLVQCDGEGYYSLSHRKLYDFLREDVGQPHKLCVFTVDEEKGYHKQFARWCDRDASLDGIWEDTHDSYEQERRTYARKHYITHLALARAYEQLWQVIDTGDYGKAKLRYDSSPRNYVLDLDRARDAAIAVGGDDIAAGIALLPRLWRYSLLQCSLNDRADKLPDGIFPLMVQLGQEQDAIRLSELLTYETRKFRILVTLAEHITSPELQQQLFVRARTVVDADANRTRALTALVELMAAQTRQGDVTGARVNLTEAQALVAGITDAGTRARAQVELAGAQARQGDVVGARAIVVEIAEANERARAQIELMAAQAQRGDAVGARASLMDAQMTVAQIAEARERSILLKELVVVQAQQGDVVGAKATAEQIAEVSRWVEAQVELAKAQARQGDLAGARASLMNAQTTVEQIEDGGWQASLQMGIAVVQARQGDLMGAQATMKGMTNAWTRAGAQVAIAVTQARRGDLAGAQAMVEQIADAEYRAKAQVEIATVQVAQGDVAGAWASLTDAQVTTARRSRWEPLLKIAVAQAQQGDVVGAQATMERIADAEYRAEAQVEIATVQVAQGYVAGARASLTDAQATVEQIMDISKRMRAREKLAVAQTQQGDVAGARATVARIEGPWQAFSLMDLAVAQADQGDVLGARATVAEIAEARWRAKAQVRIAMAQITRGDVAGAQASLMDAQMMVTQIVDAEKKVEVQAGIATVQAQQGDVAGARATVADAQTTVTRIAAVGKRAYTQIAIVEAQIAIATAQAAQGDVAGARASLTDARETTEQIVRKREQARVLMKLARAQAAQGDVAGAWASLTDAQAVVMWVINPFERANDLVKIADTLAIVGEPIHSLELVQQEWRSVTTEEYLLDSVQQKWGRVFPLNYLLHLMPLVIPLFAINTEIAPAIVQSFDWVEAMLTY